MSSLGISNLFQLPHETAGDSGRSQDAIALKRVSERDLYLLQVSGQLLEVPRAVFVDRDEHELMQICVLASLVTLMPSMP